MSVGSISRDSVGRLELELTSDTIGYDEFPKWAKSFLLRYNGTVIKRVDGPDSRVQFVRLLGQDLRLEFCDFPVQTSLVAESPAAEVVLHAIYELERNASFNQSPEPTWVGASVLRLSVLLRHVTVPTWLSSPLR